MLTFVFFLVGLIFGSFICAAIGRMHDKKNWVSDRSRCAHCNHILEAKDLIPVISWLTLKGKCRYCKKTIGYQEPLVEVFTGSLFALSYGLWQNPTISIYGWLELALWLVVVVMLVGLFIYDVKWMLLPNKLVAVTTAFVALLVIVLVFSSDRPGTFLLSALLGAGLLFGIFYGLFAISKGKWIGGGDVKLAPALGLLAGSPSKALLLLFIASVLGTLVSLPLLLSKKLRANAQIPFGPFLIAATIIVYLFGASIIDWYLHKVLYL